jgi:hypothetical protein
LDTLEPTDPKAQQLRMRISEEQKKATGLKQSIGEELSEPITEAERQQAELTKAIVEEPAPTVKESLTVQPTEAAPVAAPVEQVVTPPVEVATTIVEPAPVEPITPAPVTEQAAPAEAPAPEVASVEEKLFQPDDELVMRSPYTGEDTIVSYRGKPSDGQAVVWTGKMQMQIPEFWLRKKGEEFTEKETEGEAAPKIVAEEIVQETPKEEVEKLHRDIRSNPDIHLAIMVALQASIVGHGKAGDIDIEVLEDGRMIIYVNYLFRREDPVLYLQTLRPILDIVDARKETKAPQESEEVETLKFKVKIVHQILLNHQKTLTTLHNSVVQQKKKMDQMNSELLALVRKAESDCKDTIHELLTQEENEEAKLTETLNPDIFTKASPLELNPNQKIFLAWLQENCREDPKGEIESKKFLEALKPTLKTEKELKDVRELLQDFVWPKGGKKIKGLRLLS